MIFIELLVKTAIMPLDSDKDIIPESKEIVFSEVFSQSNSFKASKVHLDTLNRENKIVDNSIKNIADQLTKRLNVIFN